MGGEGRKGGKFGDSKEGQKDGGIGYKEGKERGEKRGDRKGVQAIDKGGG